MQAEGHRFQDLFNPHKTEVNRCANRSFVLFALLPFECLLAGDHASCRQWTGLQRAYLLLVASLFHSECFLTWTSSSI